MLSFKDNGDTFVITINKSEYTGKVLDTWNAHNIASLVHLSEKDSNNNGMIYALHAILCSVHSPTLKKEVGFKENMPYDSGKAFYNYLSKIGCGHFDIQILAQSVWEWQAGKVSWKWLSNEAIEAEKKD